jgi:hypothetical protein
MSALGGRADDARDLLVTGRPIAFLCVSPRGATSDVPEECDVPLGRINIPAQRGAADNDRCTSSTDEHVSLCVAHS